MNLSQLLQVFSISWALPFAFDLSFNLVLTNSPPGIGGGNTLELCRE